MRTKRPEDWLDEIDLALEYRKIYGMEHAWEELERMYLHDPRAHTALGPNLVYSSGDSLISSLAVPDPEFLVRAENQRSVATAPIVERLANKLVQLTRLQEHLETGILNSYLASRLILKVGFDSEFGYDPFFDVGATGIPIGATFSQFYRGKRIEFKHDVRPGLPWLGVVHPKDFVVPWGVKDIEDSPWVAHRIPRMNIAIKRDQKYRNTGKLEPQVTMRQFMEDFMAIGRLPFRASTFRDSVFHTITQPLYNILWEIYDKESNELIVIAEDHSQYLRKDPCALMIAGFPFVSFTLVPAPRTFWSTPQAYYLRQLQTEQFDIALQGHKTRRVNVVKFLADKNMIGKDEAEKLVSADVGGVGMVDPRGKSVRDIMTAMPQPGNLATEIESNRVQGDARMMLGYSRNQMGEFDKSTRRTAREATFVQMGSQLRTTRKESSIKRVYKKCMRKMITYWTHFRQMPAEVFVEGRWQRFVGTDIEGEFSYDLSLTTKRNISMAERRMEAIALMVQLAPFVQGLGPEKIQALFQRVVDASGDPSFQNLVGPGQRSMMPKLPAYGGTNSANL